MVGISSISNVGKANSVNFQAKSKVEETAEISDVNKLEREPIEDSLELKHKKGEYELTKEDKQQILYKARKNAAGWSIFGEVISTLYYGLRSDETVAKKFDLDPVKDQKFIKKIKRDQMLATLPSALMPSLGGIAAYVYCNTQDASEINVD